MSNSAELVQKLSPSRPAKVPAEVELAVARRAVWNYCNPAGVGRDDGRRERMKDEGSMSTPSVLISKLWNYCSILRDDGLSYGDYVEQLIPQSRDWCLKMADGQAKSLYLSPEKPRDAAATIPKLSAGCC